MCSFKKMHCSRASNYELITDLSLQFRNKYLDFYNKIGFKINVICIRSKGDINEIESWGSNSLAMY